MYTPSTHLMSKELCVLCCIFYHLYRLGEDTVRVVTVKSELYRLLRLSIIIVQKHSTASNVCILVRTSLRSMPLIPIFSHFFSKTIMMSILILSIIILRGIIIITRMLDINFYLEIIIGTQIKQKNVHAHGVIMCVCSAWRLVDQFKQYIRIIGVRFDCPHSSPLCAYLI